MQDRGYELPRILIPRTSVNKPLYKRRRGDPLRSPLLLLWGLGPPAKAAWGSYIDQPRAYLLTRCGPPFSMPLACCRRNSLCCRRRRVTVYPGHDALIDVKLQSVWFPRLPVIDVKACCRVRVFSCQQCSLTKRRVVLHGDKQPRVHDRVIRRASVRGGIYHVADVVIVGIRGVGNAGSATLREGDVRGYPRIGSARFAVVGALLQIAVVALAVDVGAEPFDARFA
jgi:hypothetical protein